MLTNDVVSFEQPCPGRLIKENMLFFFHFLIYLPFVLMSSQHCQFHPLDSGPVFLVTYGLSSDDELVSHLNIAKA